MTEKKQPPPLPPEPKPAPPREGDELDFGYTRYGPIHDSVPDPIRDTLPPPEPTPDPTDDQAESG